MTSPNTAGRRSAGVWDSVGGYPPGTVVTRLSWGRIDPLIAQRVLESDRIKED